VRQSVLLVLHRVQRGPRTGHGNIAVKISQIICEWVYWLSQISFLSTCTLTQIGMEDLFPFTSKSVYNMKFHNLRNGIIYENHTN
jgi:hypothetical protein